MSFFSLLVLYNSHRNTDLWELTSNYVTLCVVPKHVSWKFKIPLSKKIYIYGNLQLNDVSVQKLNSITVPTRCDLPSLLHFCGQLYVFRVLTLIIRSWYSCNCSFWYWLTESTTIRSSCWVVPYGRYSNTYRTVHVNQFQPNNQNGW